MNENVIIFEGVLKLESALSVGSGERQFSDADIILTTNGHPYIPATSFMGVLYHTIVTAIDKKSKKTIGRYWGTDHENKSAIICSDLHLAEASTFSREIRDGIKINNATGTVEPKGKYDREVLAAGVEFRFTMETKAVDTEASKVMTTLIGQLKSGIAVGAKTSTGLGRLSLQEEYCLVKNFDLSKAGDKIAWLNYLSTRTLEGLENCSISDANLGAGFPFTTKKFSIVANLRLDSPMIIRGYPSNPMEPDAVHLKSGSKNILSGSSLKGALRARAEKILKTLGCNNPAAINQLFGWVESDAKKAKLSKPIPSRFFVNEVFIDDATVTEQEQTRIKIDRFTGGTIETALFDSKPIYPKGEEQIKKLMIEIENPVDFEIGLTLLLLKDLWTKDIAIGGEKNVGRGTLKGETANIYLPGKSDPITINGKGLKKEEEEKLQTYVTTLNSSIKKLNN